MAELHITQHKRFVPDGTYPNFCFAKNFFYAENNVQNCSAILNSGRRDITLDVLVAEQLRTSSGWRNFDRYKTKLRREINMANQKEKDNAKENSRKNILKRLLQVTISVLVVAIILFTSAGRIDWIYAWTFIGASILIIIINAFLFPPELIAERGQI
jgi:amino acid permease